jgi:hypothetical protein
MRAAERDKDLLIIKGVDKEVALTPLIDLESLKTRFLINFEECPERIARNIALYTNFGGRLCGAAKPLGRSRGPCSASF